MHAYRRSPRCPRDRHPLAALAIGAGTAFGCAGCAGVFLDDEAFGFVRASFYAPIARSSPVPTDLVPWDSSAALGCPVCTATMKRTEIAGVAVDFCPEHGTWFDACELVAVAHALLSKEEQARGERGSGAFEPWAPSAEAAAEIKALNAQLRSAVTNAVLAHAVNRLQRPWWVG